MSKKSKVSFTSAVSLIVSNMIGMGVFTSLGYQVVGIKSIPALLMLWVAGGIIALCGSFVYAELGLRFPRSGGEYNFLSRIYHPALGFLSGWVSSTVAFAAPMALSAMAFGKYFYVIFPVFDPEIVACVLLLLITATNLVSLNFGTALQRIFTFLNIGLIFVFIIYGLINSDASHFEFKLNSDSLMPIFSSSFAESLVYVSFAYSGWNSVTYIIDEVENPSKILPKALAIATGIVLVLYVGLNFIFLYSTPIYELELKPEIGAIAATNIFGAEGARFISALICIALYASINSMLIAGPRVIRVMGEDFSLFKFLSKQTETGIPIIGTLFMSVIAFVMVLTASFDQVFKYIGFTLSLYTLLTVIGIFIAKSKNLGLYPSYKTWGFPITAILFIVIEGWMVIFLLKKDPKESVAGLLTILSGLVVYFIVKQKNKSLPNENL
ncbi:MAG: hypothetical protein RLZZ175_29 [Bacteroidota bacterium]|jgi:APA family basic amino acid/polyamine antiporter